MADIIRKIKNNNYTVMSNHHLQNPRLSLKAVGLLSKVLSLPDDWKYSIRGLAALCKDGYESVRTALTELEAEGYLLRRQIRNVQGQIGYTEYLFRESPELAWPEEVSLENQENTKEEQNPESRMDTAFSPEWGNPILDKNCAEESTVKQKKEEERQKPEGDASERPEPESGFPITGFPTTGNPTLLNTNKQNTINNKYTLSSSSSSSGREKEGSQMQGQIRIQIAYDSLCREFDKVLVDAVAGLMEEAYQGKKDGAVCINRKQVTGKELCFRFRQLKYIHIREILSAMQSGPPIRNIRGYLLTALYQAHLTSQVNALREPVADSPKKQNQFNSFHQRSYDFEQLEQELLN